MPSIRRQKHGRCQLTCNRWEHLKPFRLIIQQHASPARPFTMSDHMTPSSEAAAVAGLLQEVKFIVFVFARPWICQSPMTFGRKLISSHVKWHWFIQGALIPFQKYLTAETLIYSIKEQPTHWHALQLSLLTAVEGRAHFKEVNDDRSR